MMVSTINYRIYRHSDDRNQDNRALGIWPLEIDAVQDFSRGQCLDSIGCTAGRALTIGLW